MASVLGLLVSGLDLPQLSTVKNSADLDLDYLKVSEPDYSEENYTMYDLKEGQM